MVDYVIISAKYLNDVKQFAIGEIAPHSDHCPLTFHLSTKAGSLFTIKLCKDIPGREELHPTSRLLVPEMKETINKGNECKSSKSLCKQ